MATVAVVAVPQLLESVCVGRTLRFEPSCNLGKERLPMIGQLFEDGDPNGSIHDIFVSVGSF